MNGYKRAFCFAFALTLAGYSPAARSQETIRLPSAASGLTESDVQKIIGNYFQVAPEKKGQDAADAAQPPAVLLPAPQLEQGNPLGAGMAMPAQWANGLWFTTPQKDFTMHIGGWVQFDNVRR